MKRKKNRFYKLPNVLHSRNKWARRGRAITHFFFSILITTATYIADLVILVVKEISYLFDRKKVKIEKQTSSAQTTQPTILSDYTDSLDRKTIKSILQTELSKKQTAGDIDIGEIAEIIKDENYAKADVIKLVEIAEKRVIKRQGTKNPRPLCMADFLKTLESFTPTAHKTNKKIS